MCLWVWIVVSGEVVADDPHSVGQIDLEQLKGGAVADVDERQFLLAPVDGGGREVGDGHGDSPPG